MRCDKSISRRWLLPAVILLVLALIAAVFLLHGGMQNGRPNGNESVFRPTFPTRPVQTRPNWPGTDQTLPAQTGPAEWTWPEEMTLPIVPTEDGFEWDDPPEEDVPEETLPPEPVDPQMLAVERYARFSGQYAEDGRDELVENVAAILVTNISDQFLDLGTLTYDIDGREAVFIVTGLPAGRSAWVMESTRMVIQDSAVMTHVDTMTSYRSDVIAQTEAVTLVADVNMLTAVNNTGQTLEDVFVYYKTLHTDGNFFGGITYRVDFGTLEPGGSAEMLAGHYRDGETEIVRIGWVGQ